MDFGWKFVSAYACISFLFLKRFFFVFFFAGCDWLLICFLILLRRGNLNPNRLRFVVVRKGKQTVSYPILSALIFGVENVLLSRSHQEVRVGGWGWKFSRNLELSEVTTTTLVPSIVVSFVLEVLAADSAMSGTRFVCMGTSFYSEDIIVSFTLIAARNDSARAAFMYSTTTMTTNAR